MRGMRAPTAVAPALGLTSGVPSSGARSGSVMWLTRSSYPPRPEIVREVDADAHRQVGKGDEGDHVDRAHSWMLAAVAAQVDPFRGNGGTGHRRVDRERRLGHKGDDHPV